MTNTGTAQRCDCDGREVMAVADLQRGMLEVRDRRHGTAHHRAWHLSELVNLLDPRGTSYTAVK